MQGEVLKVRRRVLGEEHPATLRSKSNLARSLPGQGQYADAKAMEREVLAVRRRVLGEKHPDTLTNASNLVFFLSDQGQLAETKAVTREMQKSSKRKRSGH
jgi:hypothetical protein